MLTRRHVEALPADELTRAADAALRADAERYGWRPVRAATIPRWMRVEAVLNEARRHG
jgi:hypothetical protein